ncbi:phosphoethanolamine transferase [Paraglaciecola hydrolytica]|uniref:Uncharacterized protein n=1 Tax=Paraglaciecola hydrolytica TaxID=1799789 RepID=A0A136A4G4_9ALTE|nr:phosphoethanolamine--lipid A transferase [Paraglaciecola hydrolytica]KXI30096.1 hypothetical protein AX660_08850 [Paraglaciecola hydrolytica]
MSLNQYTVFARFGLSKLTPSTLILLFSAFITLSCNSSFFAHFSAEYVVRDNLGFMAAVTLIIFALTALLIAITQVVLPLRGAIALILFISVLSAYFADQFGVVIDVEMIRNSLQTDMAEASDLLNVSLLWRLAILLLVPMVLISLLPINSAKPEWLQRLKTSGKLSLFTLSLITLCIFSFSAQFTSFIREHKPLRYYINPLQPLYSGIKYYSSQFNNLDAEGFTLLANYSEVPTSDPNRELIIMVVGETARVDHFGLNGYARQTNPLLSKEPNLIFYPEISSCGTSTAISVPCMFSLSSKDEFDVDTAEATENAFDIIAKAGVSVLWRDINSDSKGVAVRQPFQDFRNANVNPQCDEECRDVGMLDDLQAYIDQQQQDIFIVLHQMGSHGPAYYKRYPREFERFTPACQSAELSQCSDADIINAYDNSILYTDYFLSKVIELLKKNNQKFQTSMLYVSDHGESLGENGLYLHGLPYAFAPKTQTHVPVILWTDERSDIDIAATRLQSQVTNSHDAVAKTLINLFELETDVSYENVPDLLKFKSTH